MPPVQVSSLDHHQHGASVSSFFGSRQWRASTTEFCLLFSFRQFLLHWNKLTSCCKVVGGVSFIQWNASSPWSPEPYLDIPLFRNCGGPLGEVLEIDEQYGWSDIKAAGRSQISQIMLAPIWPGWICPILCAWSADQKLLKSHHEQAKVMDWTRDLYTSAEDNLGSA